MNENSENSFKPINPVYFVEQDTVKHLEKDAISIELIGEKAYGLTCLPAKWTYPFICLSSALIDQCKYKSQIEILDVISSWHTGIAKALKLTFIDENRELIIRSSSINEGIEERGEYYSKRTYRDNFFENISQCLYELVCDKRTNSSSIPLILQEYANSVKSCGHLSNERRFYEETRDWVGEYEKPKARAENVFRINLRNWRKIIPIGKYINQELDCNLSIKIQDILKIPATSVISG